MRQLESYQWPGNVRELENLVERLSVCAQGRMIEMADLPAAFVDADDGSLLDGAEAGSALAGEDSQEIWPDFGAVPEPVSVPERSELLDTPARRGPVVLAPDAEEAASTNGAEAPATPVPANLSLPVDLPNLLRTLEDFYIRTALEQSGGNKKAAAHLLGLGRTTLVEKLRRRAADVSAP
jgi:sigma-54 specific flagellar transcriptional regulator A